MENFKDLVRFNRYKSVESFNNATDITSSTISIVRLDKNVMDIYLGRTKLTHSNLAEANNELEKLINSLSAKIDMLDSDVDNSKKTVNSIKVKQNTHSQSIIDINKDIKALQSEDNHIFEILGEIRNKISNISDNEKIPTFSDIASLKQNIDDVSKELLSKIKNNISEINKLKIKDVTHNEDILGINKDIKALQSEDNHIFEILNGLQSVSKIIMTDIKFIKKDNENINEEILRLKEKIKFLTGVNVDNFVTLEEADRRLDRAEARLDNLELSDETFQTKVDEIDVDIQSIKQDVDSLKIFESTIGESLKILEDNDKKTKESITLLENEIKEYNDKILELEKGSNVIINTLKSLEDNIQDTNDKLKYIETNNEEKIESLKTETNDKINSLETVTNEKLKLLGSQIEELAGVDSDYYNSFCEIEERLGVLTSTDEVIQQDIEILKEKDDSLIPEDIIVAGLDSKLGAGNYNNGDRIPAGTDIYDILQNILCKELYPTNVNTVVASATANMNNLTLSLNKSATIEVGTLVKLTSGSTNGSNVSTINSKISNIEYGYSTQNNNTKECSDSYIEKECIAEVSDNKYTISASIISGFSADISKYVKTVPETKTGEGNAALEETNLGCAIEGENKITINAEGASYKFNADAIDKFYYCSNLGKTNESQYHAGIEAVSGETNRPTKSASASVTGKYKYFLGYSTNTSYEQFDSNTIRQLTVKSDWLNINSNTEVIGGTAIKSNGKSIVIACPNKYKLSNIENGVGANILGNFKSQGVVKVKTGEIDTEYIVYVYPITNNTEVEFKNVKITK